VERIEPITGQTQDANKHKTTMKTQYQPKTGQKCGCKRGVQRDNCPACEGTGMRIDFAAIRARTQSPHAALIASMDSGEYDTEAMQIDDRNRHFSPDAIEDYRHENIVIASLQNGQFTQAKKQCASFGLEYAEMRQSAGLNPFPG
jgi:hypothetical protein